MKEKEFFQKATKQHNTQVDIGQKQNVTFSKIGKIANVQMSSLFMQNKKMERSNYDYQRPETPVYFS